MPGNPKKQLALDANVVLDWAEGLDAAIDFREQFLARGYEFIILPTAIVELNSLRKGGDPRVSRLATQALQNLIAWGCKIQFLSEVDEDRAEGFRIRLSELQLIPDEEWNDGLLIAESALANIPLLVTSDKHLLNIREEELLLALTEAGLPPVHPVHPKRLLQALR